jgi:hypothetical protein
MGMMNRKQKILTIVALVVFGLIVGFGRQSEDWSTLTVGYYYPRGDLALSATGTNLFALVVVYLGLLFVLGDKRK